MTTKRRHRFKRVIDDKPPFRPQPRDIEIIKHVHDYRFLQSDQIQLLMPGSSQVILRRLQKLFHHGYLDRLNNSIYEKCIYALGNTGAGVLTTDSDIDRGKIDWIKKNREVGNMHIEHTLMISNFRVALTLALFNNSNTKISWTPESEKLRDSVLIEESGNKKIKFPFFPDGYLCIKYKGNYLNFFLEADRSTMTNDRFLRKMKAYWHFYIQGKHKAKFGITSFRVLTITKTEMRKENLRSITKQADNKKIGSEMFWFTSEEKYNTADPETILRPIWQTAKDNEARRLLE